MSSDSQMSFVLPRSISENSSFTNHQLDQITPVVFKFRGEKLYDRNIWRQVTKMNQFNPENQWKFIIDLQITELYDQLPIDNQVLGHLCFKNHRQLVVLLIKKDVNQFLNLSCGLKNACRGGHRDLVQMMIDRGARDFDWGLRGACQGNQKNMAQMMIDLGATNVNIFKKYFPDHQ